MARVELPQSRVRSRRRRRRIVIACGVIFLLSAIVGGVVWLSWAPFLRINTISVNGAETISSSTIQEFVEKNITGSYLHLFAKNNIFLYPKDQLVAGLVKSLPTIASVEVNTSNFTALTVSVTERQPKALWCGESVAAPSQCLLLDQGGAAYAPLDIPNTSYEHYYGSLVGSTTPKQFLSPASFGSLSALVDTLSQGSWQSEQNKDTIASIEVDANSDVQVHFASGFTLIFSLLDAGGDVYERFTLALTSELFTQHKFSDFQYLDLRFGDKLYYKLK